MPTRGSPPTSVDVRSRDPEASHEMLRRTYTDFVPSTHGSLDEFRFAFSGVMASGISIGRVRYSMSAEMDTPAPETVFLAATCLGGHAGFETATEAVDGARGSPRLMPLDRDYRYGMADVAVHTVSLDVAALDRAARSALGVESARPRFHSMLPLSRPLAGYWWGVASRIEYDVLAHVEVACHPLVLATAVRAMATATVLTFPGTVLDQLETSTASSAAEPAALRRALEHIEAHAGEDLGVDDIAVAARVGVRALQHLFRRHRDSTPTDHLRRVRLARAHADLQAGDTARGESVAAIAARWGFAHPGRFSVRYHQTYGCSPSETLRR